MNQYEVGAIFREMTAPLEEEAEQRKKADFKPEPRPIPEGLLIQGIPLGHIALRGDFERQPSSDISASENSKNEK